MPDMEYYLPGQTWSKFFPIVCDVKHGKSVHELSVMFHDRQAIETRKRRWPLYHTIPSHLLFGPGCTIVLGRRVAVALFALVNNLRHEFC